uniref:Uncharacterized protein n=1 Tax=Alexandrium monilatum TaxID=311494 RepID=A0A7S4PV54_9DINO
MHVSADARVPLQGLRQVLAPLRTQRFFASLRRRLRDLDLSYAFARHTSEQMNAKLLAQLDSELGSFAGEIPLPIASIDLSDGSGVDLAANSEIAFQSSCDWASLCGADGCFDVPFGRDCSCDVDSLLDDPGSDMEGFAPSLSSPAVVLPALPMPDP